MDMIRDARNSGLAPGQFEGRSLVSMPDMASDIFTHSVIYICVHNDEGALGFIVNKPAPISFVELLAHAETGESIQALEVLAEDMAQIRTGGPVDTNRGFVFHTMDYKTQNTVDVGNGLGLTSNVSILKAMAEGTGPKKAAIMLGYAGWEAGQLEGEIADNGWLVSNGDAAVIFDPDHEPKYGRALGDIGINGGNFVTEAGRA